MKEKIRMVKGKAKAEKRNEKKGKRMNMVGEEKRKRGKMKVQNQGKR